jgi:hypothetical protein
MATAPGSRSIAVEDHPPPLEESAFAAFLLGKGGVGSRFRFVRATPPGLAAAARVHPASRAVLDTAESPTAAESPPCPPRNGSGGRIARVDAIPAKLLLDERAFVLGVDVPRHGEGVMEPKQWLDSGFDVAADPIGVSPAHLARTTHLADAPRTRATGEISVHALLLSV